MPVRVFVGDDLYSMAQAVERLAKDGGFTDLDVLRLNAQAAPRQSVLMTVGTRGLFTERRLIVLDGLGHEKKGRGKSAEEELTIAAIAAVAAEQTTVVIQLTGLRSDSRLMKEAPKLARDRSVELRTFPAPKAKDMAGWLGKQAAAQGIQLDGGAARQLALRLGERPSIAGMELEKLATAAGPDGVITAHLVDTLVARTAEESIFPLIDAIAGRDRDRAFQLLARQLEQIHGSESEVSLRLIRLLARQFRLLLRIRLMMTAGHRRDDVIEALKLPSYFAGRYFAQAKRLSREELAGALELLAATEQGLKNGEAGPAAPHMLVADLTQATRAGHEPVAGG